MASKQVLAVLLSLATALLPFAMTTDIIVGDENGWMPGFNYTEWAASKVFMVGDNLVFEYSVGDHNVIPVGGEEFKACNATGATKVFNTGHDVIPLKTTGKRWYLCGIAGHCQGGQKLVINVLPAASPAPALSPPAQTSSSNSIMKYTYRMVMVIAAVIAIMNGR
ncbi:blue copper protein 1a-like [Curcuma longa]|uniref:blue copper protein 1a-like n=1 Tax=Curcuma longa TaxID=136217 RepID=UPI003D9FAE33